MSEAARGLDAHDMLSRGSSYVLRVSGDAMADELIGDGDYLIVNARHAAEDGETVVVLVPGGTALVRKFFREADGRVRLQPARGGTEPSYHPASEVHVQGIVVSVIRKY